MKKMDLLSEADIEHNTYIYHDMAAVGMRCWRDKERRPFDLAQSVMDRASVVFVLGYVFSNALLGA